MGMPKQMATTAVSKCRKGNCKATSADYNLEAISRSRPLEPAALLFKYDLDMGTNFIRMV